MRTTVLILGLIAATFLFLGGCSAYLFGSVAISVEESFDVETDDEGTTSEDVQVAGAFALLVSIFLFVAAGLAKVALRISLAFLALSVPMLLGLVFIDPTSLFAVTYYLGLILIGICTVLMFLAWRRGTRGDASTAS